jgi:hypothetical protein
VNGVCCTTARRVSDATTLIGSIYSTQRYLYLAEKFDSPLLPKGNDHYQVLKWMFSSAEYWRVFSTYLFDERITNTRCNTTSSG